MVVGKQEGRALTVAGWAELLAGSAPVLVGAALLRHEVARAGTEAEPVGEAVVGLAAAPCRGAGVGGPWRKTGLLVCVDLAPGVVACRLGEGAAGEQGNAGQQQKPPSWCWCPRHGCGWAGSGDSRIKVSSGGDRSPEITGEMPKKYGGAGCDQICRSGGKAASYGAAPRLCGCSCFGVWLLRHRSGVHQLQCDLPPARCGLRAAGCRRPTGEQLNQLGTNSQVVHAGWRRHLACFASGGYFETQGNPVTSINSS